MWTAIDMRKITKKSGGGPEMANVNRTDESNMLGMTDEETDSRRGETDGRIARSVQDNATLKCQAAAQVDGKVETLGEAYNGLEESVFTVEGDIMSMKGDIRSLKERLKPYEDYKTEVQNATQKLTAVEASISKMKANSRDSPLAEEMAKQEARVRSLQQRLATLEHRSAAPDTSLSTHELTQILLGRFDRGDVLQPAVAVQLQTALSVITGTSAPRGPGQLPHTPALTEPSTRQTTASEVPSSDEPPFKRPRGRPPVHGRYARKLSIGSLSDAASKTSEIAPTRPKTKETPESDAKTKEDNTSEASAEVEESQERDDDAQMDVDTSGEQVPIPPERRSARKTQRTKQFGDTVSWKEANLQIKRMRPSAP